jgi:hypothetical protein
LKKTISGCGADYVRRAAARATSHVARTVDGSVHASFATMVIAEALPNLLVAHQKHTRLLPILQVRT